MDAATCNNMDEPHKHNAEWKDDKTPFIIHLMLIFKNKQNKSMVV